jgi:RNA polymerase sigma factor (sigma-70 family)
MVPLVGDAWIQDLGVRLASAEADAFRDCYAELGPMLRRYLHGRVPEADIDDVMQVVFVELWRFRSRFDPRRSLEAWVLTIARRRAIDHLRARHWDPLPLDDAAAMPGPDGRDIAHQVEQARDMQAALARLPSPQREAIEMAYYADLTQREIAARLDVPLGTIKARIARGLHRLAAYPAALLSSGGSHPMRVRGGVGSGCRCVPLRRPGRRTGRSRRPLRPRTCALRAGPRRPR